MIYIGIDGGGTKTKAAALDEEGAVVAESMSGSLNHYVVGLETAVEHLQDAVSQLPIDHASIAAVGIGNPALDDLSDDGSREVFLKKVREKGIFPSHTRLYMKSDVYMALYGHVRGNPGVLIVAGTGSMGVATDAHGHVHVAGGWGVPSEDPGSGYAIAAAALRTVFDADDGIGKATALSSAACAYFHAVAPRNLIGILNAPDMRRDTIAGFAREVTALSDPTARTIAHNAGVRLAAYADALLTRIGITDAPVGIFGGVLTHAESVQQAFRSALHMSHPASPVGVPLAPPEIGAARYAIDQ
ncbi:MAG: BadF/BadG/BcrA/BcrD ATPase family protein [Clostridiaceae bacterium]|nr:BadF/BadG/BcrA/BcrD ATPase family protein [Clostridiaceae bacterium]